MSENEMKTGKHASDFENNHGALITLLKEKSGMTWEELSHLTGYSVSSLHRWAQQKEVRIERMAVITEAIGLNVAGYIEALDIYKRKLFVGTEQKEGINTDTSYKNRYILALEKLEEKNSMVEDYREKYESANLEIYNLQKELDKLKKETGHKRDSK